MIINICTKSQFDQLARWDKYELLESLEKLNRQGNCMQVQVSCCCNSSDCLEFNKLNIIKSEITDNRFYSPLELLNIFDG